MNPTTMRVVQTTFRASTAAFVAPVQAMAATARGAGAVISRMSSMISPLTAALGGIGVGLLARGISQLGSSFETTQNQMGGFLSALGLAGDFNQGLQMAADTMKAINAAAAILPGEAEDYVQVFKSSLPVIQAAVGGTVKEMYTFSNQMTAVGMTLGVDSQQIGMDMNRLFREGQGGAGLMIRTWREFLPFIRKVDGQANITAETFNRMTSHQRVELYKKAMAGLQPMLDKASSSWDAQAGAFTSAMKALMRISSAPLFDNMKKGLGQVNAMLMDSEGNLVGVGLALSRAGIIASTLLVNGISAAVNVGKILYEQVSKVASTIASSPGFKAMGQAAQNVAGGVEGVVGGVGKSVASLGQPLMEAFNNIGASFEYATRLVGPALTYLGTLFDIAAGVVGALLPPLSAAFGMLVPPIVDVATNFFDLANKVYTYLKPMIIGLASAVGNLVAGIASVLGPVIRILGQTFMAIWRVAAAFVLPVFNALGRAFTWLIDGIADFLKWLGRGLDQVAKAVTTDTAPGQQTSTAVAEIAEQIAAAQKAVADRERTQATAAAAAARTAPKARGGAHTTNDFRGSRFDIKQQFAQGFDPGRISVAFVEELVRGVDHKIGSNMMPALGVG